MSDNILNVISLGAGVQSSTMALMAVHGEITPMPDCAIFADTQSEPAAVYEWLDWLEWYLPFPVYRVTRGNLGEAACLLRTAEGSGNTYASFAVPAYLHDGEKTGLMMRQCTSAFKIEPIQKKLGDLVGRDRGSVRVSQWIGISLDEVSRMKPARLPWIDNRWPLIERSKTRSQCLDWLVGKGYALPPRSACVFCPFHKDVEWRRLKEEDPDAFNTAVIFEESYQKVYSQIPRVRGVPHLHRSLQRLGDIDFSRGEGQPDPFNNECEGVCGL